MDNPSVGEDKVEELKRDYFKMDNPSVGEDKVEELKRDYFKMDNPSVGEDKVEELKVGMRFNTIGDVKEAYRRHGHQLGFAIKTSSSRNGDDGECIHRAFACAHSGKSKSTREFRKRSVVNKTDCKAKLNASRCPDGKWKVSSIIHDHNHPLSPGESRLDILHRKLKMNDNVQNNENKNFSPCVADADEYENIPFLEEDRRSYIDKRDNFNMDNTSVVEDRVEELKVGMRFNTIGDVKEAYRRHGYQLGFPIKTSSSRNGDDGECIHRAFACGHSGKSKCTREFRKRLVVRKTDCKAKLNASRCSDGKWKVSSIIHDHNHPLGLGKSCLYLDKRKLEMNDRELNRVNKNFSPRVAEAGECENVPILEADHRSYIDERDYFKMDNTSVVEDQVEELKVGMRFNTIGDLKEAYRRHGQQLGFPIVISSSRNGDDGECIHRAFTCAHSGKLRFREFRIRSVSSKKTGCKAKLNACRCPDGKWKVSSMIHDHNHPLYPDKSRLDIHKRKREMNDRSENKVNKNFTRMAEVSEYENVPFLGEDRTSYFDKVRQFWLCQGNASTIQDYFMKMQTNNSNFFYTVDLDDEGRLRNVFWADARSKEEYEEFGDAITFDTTYLTSMYAVPFVAFVGVNHHGQPTLLGCGLLSGEDTEIFTWLFKSWLACMSGSAPKAIITDQDIAMQKAIQIVFPNTRHRWCLWHVLKKISVKLRSYKQYESIMPALHNVVYDSLTHDEFEEHWNKMIEKFNLQSNEWLIGLYSERHRWVPTFMKDTFWAGMSTSQHNESLHSLFDGYVNSRTTLKQFMEQYEQVLRSKVEKENDEDINSLNSPVPCITHYAMEKQFQYAYTPTKFKEFQEELTGKIYCQVSSVKKANAYSEYEISEDMKVAEMDRRVTFKVSLTHDDCDVHCSCCLFESRGILCRHAVVVLIHHKILRLPEKYIVQCWRKDLKRQHKKVKISYDDWSSKPEAQRFDKMCNAFREIADSSTDSEDTTNRLMNWINELKQKVKIDQSNCGSSRATNTMSDLITYSRW